MVTSIRNNPLFNPIRYKPSFSSTHLRAVFKYSQVSENDLQLNVPSELRKDPDTFQYKKKN